jgi:hypothetical protein
MIEWIDRDYPSIAVVIFIGGGVIFTIGCFDDIADLIVNCIFGKCGTVDVFDDLSPPLIAIVDIIDIIAFGIDRFPNGAIVVIFGFGINSKVIDRVS